MLDAATRPSPLDRLDPRTRIVLVLLAALTIVLLADLRAALAALLAATLLLTASRPPRKRLGWRLLAIEGVLIGILVTLPFTVPGDPLWRVGPFTATVQGLERAGLIALRANAVAFTVLGLLGGMDLARLGRALAQLRVPSLLVHTLTFAVRYVDVLRREAGRLRDALRLRGFTPGTNLHSYRTFGWFVATLMLGSLERSERILDAMRCRGFDGTFPTDATSAAWPRRDLVLLATVGALMVIVVLVTRLGAPW